jgi:hypothetical protein
MEGVGTIILRQDVGLAFEREGSPRDAVADAADEAPEIGRAPGLEIVGEIRVAQHDIGESAFAVRRRETDDGSAVVRDVHLHAGGVHEVVKMDFAPLEGPTPDFHAYSSRLVRCFQPRPE